MHAMDKVKKAGAAVAAVGVGLLALYVAAFLFVVLLIVGAGAYVWLRWKMGQLARQMEREGRTGPVGTIEGEYVVVAERPLDPTREPRQ